MAVTGVVRTVSAAVLGGFKDSEAEGMAADNGSVLLRT